jgi:hypothetical protein
MQPLRIDVDCYGTPELNGQNIVSALKRGLPELTPGLCSHDGNFVIVGSGPSAPDFLKEIRAERELNRPICAIKGAHDLLCSNGINPDLFLCVDPRDRRENIQLANDDTIYLMASRCHPVMFDHLSNKRVVLWHSFGVIAEGDFYKGKPGIGGGSTSGLRAITVGYVMGYRNFILYGMDSCLAEDRLTKRFTGEKAGQVIDVIVGGRTFYCNGAMAQQAQEVQELMNCLPGLHLDIKGDGLLAAIWAERKRMGLTV